MLGLKGLDLGTSKRLRTSTLFKTSAHSYCYHPSDQSRSLETYFH